MKICFRNNTVEKLKKELEIAQALNNLRLYKMVKALLMIAEQCDIEEIADFLSVSMKTVYNWLSEYIIEGLSWLKGHHYRGRGRKGRLTNAQKQKLYDIVVDGPEKHGFDSAIWTSGMIAELIFRKFGVNYNPRYVCYLLKKIGLSYQKTKFESDHLDEEKRREWVNTTWPNILKEAKEKKAVILFADEVSFAQWGSLSRTWAPRGKQPIVKTTGIRKGLKMFGVIEFFKGCFHYKETEDKFNGESYITFLKEILNIYSQSIILIEDGARYHHSRLVKEYKEEMKKIGRLFTHPLPSYSPDFNPIEKLWKNTKKEATHCKYFPTFDDLRKSVVKTFNKFMGDATKVICVMKKMREEAGII